MTMFHASGSKELTPVVPHVFVYEEYVRQVPTTLCIKEKAWSLSGVSITGTVARRACGEAEGCGVGGWRARPAVLEKSGGLALRRDGRQRRMRLDGAEALDAADGEVHRVVW